MQCAYKPCPLEVNSNCRLKREHLEPFSSTTINFFIFTTAMPRATKLDKMVTNHDGVSPIKSHDLLIT